MKIAVTSTQAEQLALNNVTPALPGAKFFSSSQIEDIAEYNPDVLYLGGMFIAEYSDWQLYRAIIGDAKRVIVHWYGSDVLQLQFFKDRGEKEVLEWLKQDRFFHVSPSEAIREELYDKLGIEASHPLNVPAEKVMGNIPLPEEFTLASYLPPGRKEFFNYQMIEQAMKNLPETKMVFYHWLPLFEKIEYEGRHVLRYGLSRDEYEKLISESSCLLRIPYHDANSISAAEFLMSGRPVISNHDLPHWPKMVDETMTPDQIAEVVKSVQDNGKEVPEETRQFYRDLFDPGKFKERLEYRIKARWPEFSWSK